MGEVRKLELVSGYKADVEVICNELLESAKSGQIIEMVICTKRRDGGFYHQYSGSENLYELAGYLARMAYRVQKRIDDNME